jgi:hypothetical protein
MNLEAIDLFTPFLKLNPFEDYTLVDTVVLPSIFPEDPLFKFKAFYNPSNTMVLIERHRVLRVERTIERVKAFIRALQGKMFELFDFIIEEESRGLERPYMNIYMVKQANKGGEKITLKEFKERF